jgi:hypothetical protein
VRKLLASLSATSILVLGVVSSTAAQPQIADGLVNVQVGDITIEDAVDLNVAANAAVQACGIDVGPIAAGVLGRANAVDRSGRSKTICEVDGQAVRLVNN